MNSRRFTAQCLPFLSIKRIAPPKLRQETAALQQFGPIYVADGSIATDEVEVTRSRMSASPLKADNLHTISGSPLSAITGREQMQQTNVSQCAAIRSLRRRAQAAYPVPSGRAPSGAASGHAAAPPSSVMKSRQEVTARFTTCQPLARALQSLCEPCPQVGEAADRAARLSL